MRSSSAGRKAKQKSRSCSLCIAVRDRCESSLRVTEVPLEFSESDKWALGDQRAYDRNDKITIFFVHSNFYLFVV